MDIRFIASFSVITADPTRDLPFWLGTLGLPLKPPSGDPGGQYRFTEALEGAKHFGVWPLAEAAEACYGTPEWPAGRTVPQASLELEVPDVTAAAAELESAGHHLVHGARTEPWGQTIARLLTADGLLLGICSTPHLGGTQSTLRDATGSIVAHLPAGSGRLTEQGRETVRAGFADATRLVSAILDVRDVDVFVMDSPDQSIPGWGVGGYTNSPPSIVLAVDPDEPGLTAARVRATLVHELHHVARERGPGCGTSLRERLVSEGLAMLFEEELLGQASEFAHVEVADTDVTHALAALDEEPADEGRWFFHAGDVPLWFGYTLGYRLVRDFAAAQRSTAALLAAVPAREILPG